MRDQYMRTGEIFILTYSVTNRESFEEIPVFYNQILQVRNSFDIPMLLVANKIDLLNEREVFSSEGIEMAKLLNIPYFETSARTRINVDEIFFETAHLKMLHLVTFQINALERKKRSLKSWQIFRKIQIEKKLKQANNEKQISIINRRRTTLETELNFVPNLPLPPSIHVGESTFCVDFKKLINHKESSDQIIQIENLPFYVHKVILQLRCPQFASIWGSHSTVKFSATSYSVFSYFIEYLYTGTLSQDKKLEQSVLSELLELSYQYQLPLLSLLCMNPLNKEIQRKGVKEFKQDISSLLQKPSIKPDVILYISPVSDSSEEEIKAKERSFLCHRAVLIARSQWFYSCFCGQWKEGKEKDVIIKDMEAEVFQALLEYLYTDTLISSNYYPNIFVALIGVADQMNLPRLKELCESILPEFLDINSVLSVYQYAILHKSMQLEKSCLYFMSLPESFSNLTKQEKFREISVSIQQKLQKDNEQFVNILERRNSISKSIEECETNLKKLKV